MRRNKLMSEIASLPIAEDQPLLASANNYASDRSIFDFYCCGLERVKLFNVVVMGLGFMLLFTVSFS